MKVASIKSFDNTKFKGYTKYYTITDDMYGRYNARRLELRDTPPDRIYGYSELFTDKFKQAIYPNIRVERTYPRFCFEPTGKVYIADPMEGISDEIRKSVDYVIHDIAPKYPKVNEEISKEYFFPSYTYESYVKDFEAVRDYYKRLEAADLRTLSELKLSKEDSKEIQDKIAYYKARIKDSEYQQWQAQECLNIYNKGRDLRMQKYNLEREIDNLEIDKHNCKNTEARPAETKSVKKAAKSSEYTKDIAILEKRKQLYKGLMELPEELNSDVAKSQNYQFKNEKHALAEKIKVIDELIQKCKDGNTHLENIEKYFAELSAKSRMTVEDYSKQIAEKRRLLEEVKAKLIPMFDELKHFYANRRIIVR